MVSLSMMSVDGCSRIAGGTIGAQEGSISDLVVGVVYSSSLHKVEIPSMMIIVLFHFLLSPLNVFACN